MLKKILLMFVLLFACTSFVKNVNAETFKYIDKIDEKTLLKLEKFSTKIWNIDIEKLNNVLLKIDKILIKTNIVENKKYILLFLKFEINKEISNKSWFSYEKRKIISEKLKKMDIYELKTILEKLEKIEKNNSKIIDNWTSFIKYLADIELINKRKIFCLYKWSYFKRNENIKDTKIDYNNKFSKWLFCDNESKIILKFNYENEKWVFFTNNEYTGVNVIDIYDNVYTWKYLVENYKTYSEKWYFIDSDLDKKNWEEKLNLILEEDKCYIFNSKIPEKFDKRVDMLRFIKWKNVEIYNLWEILLNSNGEKSFCTENWFINKNKIECWNNEIIIENQCINKERSICRKSDWTFWISFSKIQKTWFDLEWNYFSIDYWEKYDENTTEINCKQDWWKIVKSINLWLEETKKESTIMSSDREKCKNLKNEWYRVWETYNEWIGREKIYYKCTSWWIISSSYNIFSNESINPENINKYYTNYLCNKSWFLWNPLSSEYTCRSPLWTSSYSLMSTLWFSCVDVPEYKLKYIWSKNFLTDYNKEIWLKKINKIISDIELYEEKLKESVWSSSLKTSWQIKIKVLEKEKKEELKKIWAVTRELLQSQNAVWIKHLWEKNFWWWTFSVCTSSWFFWKDLSWYKNEIIKEKKSYNNENTDVFLQYLNKDNCESEVGWEETFFNLERQVSGIIIDKMEILSSCENEDHKWHEDFINKECKEWWWNKIYDWYVNVNNVRYTCEKKIEEVEEVEDEAIEEPVVDEEVEVVEKTDEEKEAEVEAAKVEAKANARASALALEIEAAKDSAMEAAKIKCQEESDDAVLEWNTSIEDCLRIVNDDAIRICLDSSMNYDDCILEETLKQEKKCYIDQEYTVFEDYKNTVDKYEDEEENNEDEENDDLERKDLKDKEEYNYGAVCELEYSIYGWTKEKLYKFEWTDVIIEVKLNQEEQDALNLTISNIQKAAAERAAAEDEAEAAAAEAEVEAEWVSE